MSEQEALIGRVVDARYRIVDPLGEGGMGLVFRAEHLKLQRPVALKVLQEDFLADTSLRERFDREARALAALAHPNIVTITDYGVMDQTPYLVMELLEGETLHQRLRHGALPPDRAIAIARQMLRALAHAHRQGLVHRDLKPGNIFLTPLPDDSDHVKILDFGLVRFVDGAERPDEKNLTRAGSMLGTPAYMAPEQASGEPSDARTDVYAAGIVLFEMLAGRKPFVGEPAEVLRDHLLTPAPLLTEIHRGLEGADEIARLLARALEKEKRRRFADGAEMLAALEDVRVPTATGKPPARAIELGTMPTMHALDASKERGAVAPAPTALTMATPMRSGRAAPTPAPSTGLGRGQRSLSGLKRTAAAVGGGLAIAGMIVSLILLAASGGEEAAPAEPLGGATAAPHPPGRTAPSAEAPRGRTQEVELSPDPRPGTAATPTTPSAPPSSGPTPPPTNARPVAVDPWAAGVPRELSRAKRAVDSGRVVRVSIDRGILGYAKVHQDDPRPHLLLARAFLSRGWRSDAVERYELAARKDLSARGDARMLTDLVALSAFDDRAGSLAARAVRNIYGAEALPEIARQLESARERGARARLSRLRESIESAGASR